MKIVLGLTIKLIKQKKTELVCDSRWMLIQSIIATQLIKLLEMYINSDNICTASQPSVLMDLVAHGILQNYAYKCVCWIVSCSQIQLTRL